MKDRNKLVLFWTLIIILGVLSFYLVDASSEVPSKVASITAFLAHKILPVVGICFVFYGSEKAMMINAGLACFMTVYILLDMNIELFGSLHLVRLIILPVMFVVSLLMTIVSVKSSNKLQDMIVPLLKAFFSNVRKPEGFIGRLMLTRMNRGAHERLANWGLDFTGVPAEGEILDIGCGGGANLQRLMQRSLHARVVGVDYSLAAVEKSKEVNAASIAEGRCKVLECSVESLPFADNEFIMVTAFESAYFWPDIIKSFAEVKRVLSPEGTFVIVNEDDGLTGKGKKWEKFVENMHSYTAEQLESFLTEAGFKDIRILHEESKHWLAITAKH